VNSSSFPRNNKEKSLLVISGMMEQFYISVASG
jgi:hypothetical protein